MEIQFWRRRRDIYSLQGIIPPVTLSKVDPLPARQSAVMGNSRTWVRVDTDALVPELDAAGFTTVDTSHEDPSWLETFLRPSAAFGALFQMVETNVDWKRPHDHTTLDDVLAGRVEWHGSETRLRDPDG